MNIVSQGSGRTVSQDLPTGNFWMAEINYSFLITVNNLELSYDSDKNKKIFTLDVDLEYIQARVSWRTCKKITLDTRKVKAIYALILLLLEIVRNC